MNPLKGAEGTFLYKWAFIVLKFLDHSSRKFLMNSVKTKYCCINYAFEVVFDIYEIKHTANGVH